MKTYLVTGGAGFIGSNYIHYLMKKYGDTIRIINLDSLTYCGNRDHVKCYESWDNYSFLHGSICDEELVSRIFTENKIDYVIHFAAQTHVDRSIRSAKEFVETNVTGTLNLLHTAYEAWKTDAMDQKRFLYVSTDEVYGELPAEGYFTEDSPLCPRNPYAASKAGGDMMARAYYTTHGLPVLVTRCTNNYGPYQYEEKFIPRCIRCCLTGEAIPVYGDGKNIRDWLYVEDHCHAIDCVLNDGRPGEVYNVGGHNEHTNLEIVHMLRRILSEEFHKSGSPVKHVEDRKGHDRRYAVDSSKLQRELGWRSKTPFEEGIRTTIQWYLEHSQSLTKD